MPDVFFSANFFRNSMWQSVAGAFACLLGLGHPLAHFSFHGVEVEARAALHGRIVKERLQFLAHHLLHEHKAPELELEPVEVLLTAFFGTVVWPALPLKRIQAQIGKIGHVNVRLLTQPALRLIDETILVIIDAHRADRAFAEIEDFVTRRGALTRDGGHLVVTIQMVLVGPVAELYAFELLFGDVWVTGRGQKRRKPIQAGEDAVLDRARCHVAGPTQEAWYSETAFHHCSFALREWRAATIRPGECFRAVVGR